MSELSRSLLSCVCVSRLPFEKVGELSGLLRFEVVYAESSLGRCERLSTFFFASRLPCPSDTVSQRVCAMHINTFQQI